MLPDLLPVRRFTLVVPEDAEPDVWHACGQPLIRDVQYDHTAGQETLCTIYLDPECSDDTPLAFCPNCGVELDPQAMASDPPARRSEQPSTWAESVVDL